METQPVGRTSGEGEAWHALPGDEVATRLGTGPSGLSIDEADRRLARVGANALDTDDRKGALRLLGRQIHNPIVYLLLAACALAAALGKITDALVVLGAVVVNVVVGFIQEHRAGRAIAALARMVPQDATVVRAGRQQTLPAARLVPGDLVLLASGDRVPADLRLLSTQNLGVQEAALTGESEPVAKRPDPVPPPSTVGDRRSMAWSGTFVTAGTGSGVVVATGRATELGRISGMLKAATELQTPLTRALSKVAGWLTVAVLAISAVLLAVSLARGYALADGLLIAVTLAVATIPEGLPAIITITLAIGVQRMAARRAVVRKLPSVETLGSTSVICSDKTGTLTRNEMTVQALWTPAGTYALTGVGYDPEGRLRRGDVDLAEPPPDVLALLRAGALCNDASVHPEGGAFRVTGDPTEAALVLAAQKTRLGVDDLRAAWPRVDVVPFESEHQFMATLHPDPAGGHRLFLKGAPEVVLRRCALPPELRAEAVLDEVHRLASRGMRVLALAERRLPAGCAPVAADASCDGLTLLGLQAMIDPPRVEVGPALAICRSAGIAVKMITGDHKGTAEAIGAELGLLRPGARGLSGADIDRLGDAELARAALGTNVFARVAPEHKLRLVRALQGQGQVVAMTGDGVNDAPALKQANIGIAMGITGTAVSKEAADIVLADDNFATIGSAVEEGRRIYDNLVKALAFVLPANLGLGFILIAAVVFFPAQALGTGLAPLLPVSPTQLLWVNLVASVALSVPLAFEVREPDAMARPPRDPAEPVLGAFVVARTVLAALLMSGGAVGLFLWEFNRELPRVGQELALREAQTMAVTTVVCFQVFYLLNCRSLRVSAFRLGIFSNRAVLLGIGSLVVLQAGFIYLPPAQALFGTAPLDLPAIALAALVGAVILPVITAEKALRARLARRGPRGGDLVPGVPRRAA